MLFKYQKFNPEQSEAFSSRVIWEMRFLISFMVSFLGAVMNFKRLVNIYAGAEWSKKRIRSRPETQEVSARAELIVSFEPF